MTFRWKLIFHIGLALIGAVMVSLAVVPIVDATPERRTVSLAIGIVALTLLLPLWHQNGE